jgi:hypothetical protein
MKTFADLDTALGRRAIDELLDGYVSWREECQAVAVAYGRLIASGSAERRLAYAVYFAALDREEQAARTYAHHVERVSGISANGPWGLGR